MAVSGSFIRTNRSLYLHLNAPRLNHSRKNQFRLRASASGSDGEERKRIRMADQFLWRKTCTPLLDTSNYPVHMKNLSTQDLQQLFAELRVDIVYSVSKTGGHLSANLGVVE